MGVGWFCQGWVNVEREPGREGGREGEEGWKKGERERERNKEEGEGKEGRETKKREKAN